MHLIDGTYTKAARRPLRVCTGIEDASTSGARLEAQAINEPVFPTLDAATKANRKVGREGGI
jgi:hypothetical protein